MTNVVSLHDEKRWKAVIQYRTESGSETVEHYFEEILDLHLIIEHGTDWNRIIRCTVMLNRADDGEDQKRQQQAIPRRLQS